MKRQKSGLLVWILLALIFPGYLNPSLAQTGEVLLKIAVTTDVHGAYFPNDWYSGKSIGGSLSQVAAWAREQRQVEDQILVLLDNGDLIQGDPASYYSNFIDNKNPNIAARILNFMGYEAGTVGNHDLETGHAVYDKLGNEFTFPWLAANAVKTGSDDSWFSPYVLITHQGLRIAVLGITTPKVPDWLPGALWSGMEFQDMIFSARKWATYIVATENPDLLIGLFHSGVDPTYGQQDPGKPFNENASRLVAEQVPGFDVIFTGHDHRTWDLRVQDPEGDSVLILGSESRAAEIAVATIRMKRVGKHFQTLSITGSHQAMKEYEPDPDYLDQFRGYIDTVQQYVDLPVGTLSQTITSDDAYFGPSDVVNMIHKAQLDLTGADVSFTAPLSFRTTIPEGTLRIKDLFKLYRFENQLYTVTLTGSEIEGYLNYSYSLWINTMTGPDDPLLKMEQQKDGSWRLKNAYYNFDSAAGIDYTVDVRKPAGEMVRISQMSSGEPFDAAKSYKVALNSYRGSGGGGHLSKGAGLSKEEAAKRLITDSGMDFRYLLTGWIRKQGTIYPVSAHNWKIIPEDWAHAASQIESNRLFNRN